MATRKTTDPATDATVDPTAADAPVEELAVPADQPADQPADAPVEEAVAEVVLPSGWLADSDFTSMVGASLCSFKKGDIIDALAGHELAAGGAPVTAID